MTKPFRTYFFPIILILSIFLGGLLGYTLGPKAKVLKPFGDIFLNLIFTAIVPLIFFSVSSAIARTGALGKFGKIMWSMVIIFLVTGVLAACLSLIVVKLFPLGLDVTIPLSSTPKPSAVSIMSQIVGIFTVSDFTKLFSHQNILALIIFSLLVGIAASQTKEDFFVSFLQGGQAIFMRVFSIIMLYAPVGFFCYFAVIIGDLGPNLLKDYFRIALMYYLFALFYFICAFTFYAYLAGKLRGIKLFWRNIFLPTVTSMATCSSAASIPTNLMATKAMGVPSEIYETTIPLGALIHKDGSVIGGIFKIAFLFGIFHLTFSGLPVLITAIGISLLVGTVMGAIPSGGMLGELLILNVYGFPSSVLMVLAAISIIIDVPATILNVTGDCVSSMLIARLVEGPKWLNRNS